VPTVVVVEKLGFDMILGMDLFREAHAVVDMPTNTLTLFNGLTAVPMTATGDHPVVATTMPIVIPPMSEAVLPVATKSRLPKGEYVIEGDVRAPYRALLVGRVLLHGSKRTLPCRVLNLTTEPIKLKRGTPVGVLSEAHAASVTTSKRRPPGPERNVISAADLRIVEKFAITEMEVERMFRTMRSTAPGYDNIPSWVFKTCSYELASIVGFIIHFSFRSGIVPFTWLTAIVTPVPKVPNPHSHNDFRPISVTPLLSRLTDKLLVRNWLRPALDASLHSKQLVVQLVH
jgi:hypothetical protein